MCFVLSLWLTSGSHPIAIVQFSYISIRRPKDIFHLLASPGLPIQPRVLYSAILFASSVNLSEPPFLCVGSRHPLSSLLSPLSFRPPRSPRPLRFILSPPPGADHAYKPASASDKNRPPALHSRDHLALSQGRRPNETLRR